MIKGIASLPASTTLNYFEIEFSEVTGTGLFSSNVTASAQSFDTLLTYFRIIKYWMFFCVSSSSLNNSSCSSYISDNRSLKLSSGHINSQLNFDDVIDVLSIAFFELASNGQVRTFLQYYDTSSYLKLVEITNNLKTNQCLVLTNSIDKTSIDKFCVLQCFKEQVYELNSNICKYCPDSQYESNNTCTSNCLAGQPNGYCSESSFIDIRYFLTRAQQNVEQISCSTSQILMNYTCQGCPNSLDISLLDDLCRNIQPNAQVSSSNSFSVIATTSSSSSTSISIASSSVSQSTITASTSTSSSPVPISSITSSTSNSVILNETLPSYCNGFRLYYNSLEQICKICSLNNYFIDGRCYTTCPAEFVSVDSVEGNFCKICSLLIENNECVTTCSLGYLESNNICIACGAEFPYLYNGICLADCPANYATEKNGNAFYCQKCDPSEFTMDDKCVSACPYLSIATDSNSCAKCSTLFTDIYQTKCIKDCPSINFQIDISRGLCIDCKLIGKYLLDGVCVETCPITRISNDLGICNCDGVLKDDGSCILACDYPDGCICSEGFIFSSGNCVECKRVVESGNCVEKCSSGFSPDSSNTCKPCALTNLKYNLDGMCLAECPTLYDSTVDLNCVFISVISNPCLLCVNAALCTILTNGEANCDCSPQFYGRYCDTSLSEFEEIKTKIKTEKFDRLQQNEIGNISTMLFNYPELLIGNNELENEIFRLVSNLLDDSVPSLQTYKLALSVIDCTLTSNAT